MKKYPIKIQTKIGSLIVYNKNPRPYTGECVHCKQKIYFVKTMFGKKILMSYHNDEEYISHFLVCPTVQNRNNKKKYETRKSSS